MDDEYSIYSEFDLEQHKEKYVNYLEVLIEEDGHIVYAVPSHQEKAVELACRKFGVSRRELLNMCPKEYYFDFMTWLLMQSGAVAVWNDFCSAPSATKKQVAAIRRLKMAGVYRGAVPLTAERNEGNVNG